MKLAPIVLFVYNRPEHTKQTVEALKQNTFASESELYIYADAPKHTGHNDAVQAVREYVRGITGFKAITVIERERNWGLADSIVDGVTTVVEKYGRVIVLEDDIVTSQYFLQYMNDALELYQDEERVMHVSGYFFPVESSNLPETFFYNQTSCWGWGTWARAWGAYENDSNKLFNQIKASGRLREFDMDGNFKFSSTLRANIRGDIKTWAIKWHASVFLKNGLCLHPKKTLVLNTGHDGSGVHSQKTNLYGVEVSKSVITPVHKNTLIESSEARKLACYFLKRTKPSMMSMLIKKIWK